MKVIFSIIEYEKSSKFIHDDSIHINEYIIFKYIFMSIKILKMRSMGIINIKKISNKNF